MLKQVTTFVFTVIVIGLFGISIISMVNDVLAEKDKQEKNSNTEGSTLLLAFHLKKVVKNVLLGIQDVNKSRYLETKVLNTM